MKFSYFHILFLLLTINISSCAQTDKKPSKHQFSNALINETSPYLLQHAHNPVQWYPWGEAALEKAKKEDKMIIVSIGYAACHWCHVMEHESFEDSVVAALMNQYFVCIKVDREERPDVDQIYMNACQIVTKSGGWPLHAFALSDGKPFHAGTYFPKNEWLKVLNYFINLYQKDRKTIENAAQQLTQGIAQLSQIALNTQPSEYTINQLNTSFNKTKSDIDFDQGGLKNAPKFPMPATWDFLLQYHAKTGDSDALNAVHKTLEKMALGGIYDQLGGGFARYSTDENWFVPHFEKMLYDNAQLVSLYAQAYQQSKNPLYKKVIVETLDWISREMTSQEGAFYASLDADSEGEEGKFYTWKYTEIQQVLGADAELFMDYFACSENGNWEEEKNILLRTIPEEAILEKYNLSKEQLQEKINSCKTKMLQYRNKRPRPNLDDKILTSWNALMLNAYIKAYRALGDEKMLQTALQNAQFLVQKTIQKDGKITRNYKDGKSSVTGFLDDYAFVIAAFIELYQVTFDEKWLHEAQKLTNHCISYFYDEKTGMFNYTPSYNPALIARPMEFSDNVIPSSNSEMAQNLYKLSLYFDNQDYYKKSKQMLDNLSKNIYDKLPYFANWAKLALHFIQEPFQIAIVGKDCDVLRKELDQNYLPNVLLMGGKNGGTLSLLEGKNIAGQTTIYVCHNKTCKRPVTTIKDALINLKI